MSSAYNVEVDRITKAEWSELLQQFADASIYQTWSYGAVRWGETNLSHLVLKRNGQVVGMAQATIRKIPGIAAGIAYIPWGPLWHVHDRETCYENLANVLSALRDEYAVRRKLVLRIRPNVVLSASRMESQVFQSGGFELYTFGEAYRTFLVDLEPPLDELRKRLNAKWRNKLNGAERNGLNIIEGKTDDLYEAFLRLQKEMLERKEYEPGVDYDEFREIQRDLPERLKMHIFLCQHEGEVVSSVICSAIGDTGIYLLGATGYRGLTLKGSYLLQWRAIEWLKQNGFRWYDLGGISPDKNPGVYHFKSGLSGTEVRHIGQCDFSTSKLSSILVHVRDLYRKQRY